MDYLIGMQVAHGNDNLGCNEFDLMFSKSLVDDKMVEDIASPDILQQEVDSQLILEYVVHGENEGVARLE